MALVEFINDQPPYLNAENLNNNFNELDNKMTNLLTTQTFQSNSKTIQPNVTDYWSIDVTKQGYTPLGILFIDSDNNWFDVMKWSQFNNTCYIRVRNVNVNEESGTISIKVLYTKTN